jgi:hypothetical protein
MTRHPHQQKREKRFKILAKFDTKWKRFHPSVTSDLALCLRKVDLQARDELAMTHRKPGQRVSTHGAIGDRPQNPKYASHYPIS